LVDRGGTDRSRVTAASLAVVRPVVHQEGERRCRAQEYDDADTDAAISGEAVMASSAQPSCG
jgi:hypothetical protein